MVHSHVKVDSHSMSVVTGRSNLRRLLPNCIGTRRLVRKKQDVVYIHLQFP